MMKKVIGKICLLIILAAMVGMFISYSNAALRYDLEKFKASLIQIVDDHVKSGHHHEETDVKQLPDGSRYVSTDQLRDEIGVLMRDPGIISALCKACNGGNTDNSGINNSDAGVDMRDDVSKRRLGGNASDASTMNNNDDNSNSNSGSGSNSGNNSLRSGHSNSGHKNDNVENSSVGDGVNNKPTSGNEIKPSAFSKSHDKSPNDSTNDSKIADKTDSDKIGVNRVSVGEAIKASNNFVTRSSTNTNTNTTSFRKINKKEDGKKINGTNIDSGEQ